METDNPQRISRRKGQEIVRAYKRKQQIRALIFGLVTGLIAAAVVGLVVWKISRGR